jgi:uncharacterized protein
VRFVAPPFGAELQARLLALNNDHAEELSYKTAEQFADLLDRASVVLAEPQGLALLVGFHQHCTYDNPNFAWLKTRYARFIYIDRVVVSEAARGQGLARSLYGLLEDQALRDTCERLVCEINAVPPNPQSDAFHQKLGFTPVGEQVLEDRGKTVRYWAKELG